MNNLKHSEKCLVALGAAIASNCVPCVEFHISEALKSGLDEGQVGEAIEISDKVRRVPAATVLQSALARLERNEGGGTAAGTPGCGC